jgi:transposase, IS5 family
MKGKKPKGLFDEEFRQEKIAVKDPLVLLRERVYWEQFRNTLDSAFTSGDSSKGGRPPLDRVMMFKILVLQEMYGLSDEQMEFHLLDRLSFQKFIGLGLQDNVPDEKTIWLFRDSLTKKGIIDRLFIELNAQLKKGGFIAKKGVMVDASFAKVPVQRNTPDENNKIKNGETPDWDKSKMHQKDVDADWTQKGGQNHYGYKQHIKADVKSKLVLNFEVTPASVHDSQVLNDLFEANEDIGQPIYADSAYYSEDTVLKYKLLQMEPYIIEKGYRNKELTEKQKEKNRIISSTRCRVEHIFAWLKQKGGPLIRAIGIERVTAKITLRLIGYNLSRAVHLMKHNRVKVQYI